MTVPAVLYLILKNKITTLLEYTLNITHKGKTPGIGLHFPCDIYYLISIDIK